MDSLPAVDLGLMSEHLSAHEGVINKLKAYQAIITNNELSNIIKLQENMMQTHVWVMLALINPDYSTYVEVPSLNNYQIKQNAEGGRITKSRDNKWVALEVHSTAKNMSNTNYNSALLMQNQNVINAHIEMALQQHQIQKMYAELLENMGWTYVPHIPIQEQIKTYFHFQHLLNE